MRFLEGLVSELVTVIATLNAVPWLTTPFDETPYRERGKGRSTYTEGPYRRFGHRNLPAVVFLHSLETKTILASWPAAY